MCDSNEDQEELDANFGLASITEIPPKSKPWMESAFQKGRREKYEQEKAGKNEPRSASLSQQGTPPSGVMYIKEVTKK